MFREDKVSAGAVADGAITDADQLKGMVARNDVYPGELTTNQFQRSDTTNVAVKLGPDQRAIAFPVDPASGLIGQLSRATTSTSWRRSMSSRSARTVCR
jgi:Flp pilus assembly protein CpaB